MNMLCVIAIALTLQKNVGVQKPIMQNEIISILSNTGDRVIITPTEIELMNRCVMSEAGNQSVETQEAVATVILNRWMNPDKFPDSITGVIKSEGQFSTGDNGEPTVSVRVAVYNAIVYYNTDMQDLPKQVYYFRKDYYHNFGVPYCSMDDLYFSLDEGACID